MTRLSPRANGADVNKLQDADQPVHRWYRFVLSFPPHLVREYVDRFALGPGHCVLDPFCGTGTTLVECKKHGIPSVGIEANPMAHFASRVKLAWQVRAKRLLQNAYGIADQARDLLARSGIPDETLPLFRRPGGRGKADGQFLTLAPECGSLLLRNSISPLPLHKTLLLLEQIEAHGERRLRDHLRLAVAKVLVTTVGNLHFGPEVGVGPPKTDAPVVDSWLAEVEAMARDLDEPFIKFKATDCPVHAADARRLTELVPERSVDAVITSPPYPNEKDYTRTTRLESVLLGFLKSKDDLRALKRNMVRSNTRGVYKQDDDDRWVADHGDIQRIASQIEARRIELGKTSGFERLYPRVTKLYFGGMHRHLAELRRVLKPGARLAYVVGDQASYLRVMIRTGQILADIGASLGYRVAGIDLFRTRLATATREQLREEVVLLEWPGSVRRATLKSTEICKRGRWDDHASFGRNVSPAARAGLRERPV